MPIPVQCSTCGLRLLAPDSSAGGQVRCSSCKSVLSVLPVVQEPIMAVPASEPANEFKTCRFCGEQVRAVAVKCRHCGESLVVKKEEPPAAREPVVEAVRDCPFCGESVKVSAKKCRHCNEVIDVALRSAEEARRLAERQSGPQVFMNAGGASSSAASSASPGSSGKGGEDHSLGSYLLARLNANRKSFMVWHVVHLLLTLFTFGLWLPIWIIHFVIWNSSK